MESLSPWDAILYPLLAGMMLVGLYFLIKWLKDPEILNKILSWYLSGFGVFSVTRLLTDCMNTLHSFAFPARFRDEGVVWQVKAKDRIVVASHVDPVAAKSLNDRRLPLAGGMSRMSLPLSIISYLWEARDGGTRPLCAMKAYLRDQFEETIDVTLHTILSSLIAIAGVLYFNLVDKPWWLTNLLGLSFSYSALQLMSPTTFWTGTLVLSALFLYDIYFVFFTPVMIEVATKLDIPVKLLFPRPSEEKDDPATQALAMLGLGDIVLPGIIIGLALRFDLYLFYLKKQKRRLDNEKNIIDKKPAEDKESNSSVTKLEPDPLVYDGTGLGKAEYIQATGGWGERYWLGSGGHLHKEGGAFPKPYFYASIGGYVVGLVCTLGVMHVFKHGQPALLYLVPSVLVSVWTTALAKGELKTMWEYTEEEDAGKDKEKGERAKGVESEKANAKTKDKDEKKELSGDQKSDPKSLLTKDSVGDPFHHQNSTISSPLPKARSDKRSRRIFSLSIYMPSQSFEPSQHLHEGSKYTSQALDEDTTSKDPATASIASLSSSSEEEENASGRGELRVLSGKVRRVE